ncbi:DUF4403 family protein [Granulosicoccus antarcticus]|uniref:DUF4403 family protein n=1 Tax=Granulosicoccus antarcticus IMCC3135 TaxID=1192854 RepID=A0A2Z2NL19_9GAMM|nr:DUF4403 family protein [Granulosicoccus antarcticus]ASJ72132.1 hypothetical protein IMCC3135_10190 [Granulosicoccus antarcticus IMCC3135]
MTGFRSVRRKQLLLSIVLCSLSLSSCQRDSSPSEVSEKPENLTGSNLNATAKPRASRFGLRARVSYDDIEAIAAEQLPASYPVAGDRRVCKRIIGIKACGTAQWNLIVSRTAPIAISGQQQLITVSAPIRFDGKVGIRGSMASALGLSALDVQGEVMTTIRMGLNMRDDWCPVIEAVVDYQWVQKPVALWRGKMDFDLENIVNDALDKQLATLEPRLNEAIDCEKFREQLGSYWRSYTFALDIPAPDDSATPQQLHLNIVPSGFAFSGIHTEPDKFGVSFEVDGTTVVDSEPLQIEPLPLPALREVAFQASRTDFDLLLRAGYTQLEAAIGPRLIDRSFSSESAAGKVTVQIDSIKLSGSTAGVTVTLGFTAQLPGSRRDTHGIIYLNARPVVDAADERLRLENIQLSKVLDSTLWNLVSSIFEGQIIAAIERGSIVDLSSHTRKLEERLQQQLQDPSRTGGVTVRAENLSIRLLDIFPEADSLAARAQVSAELDIDIPLTVLKKPLK